ncbi:MAG: transposase zinc-binding domain-containing protein [Nitrospinae bacterium]|nr:transposase zinc-binding domain-containing protein [Nitrospinota bacterium]
MLVVNEPNLSDRCIPSIFQLRSGQAPDRFSQGTGQGKYRPRNPVSTPLYKIVEDYWEIFINSYDDKFQEKYGFFRPVVKAEMEKYLNCGILRNGFIRIKCPECKEEYLLPFSCKDRCLCPSCAAKRSVLFADFISNEVIEPVPHRHLVFSLPKIIRPYFKFDRKLITMLSRCAYDSVKEICQTLFDKQVMPGMIIAVQTFSDDLGWHPHLHALITDGIFDEKGVFHPLEHLSLSYIKEVFERKVLIGLRMKELISEETIKLILSWHHTGFHVHHETRISAGDTRRIEKVASYLIRSPISLEGLSYNDQNANIT